MLYTVNIFSTHIWFWFDIILLSKEEIQKKIYTVYMYKNSVEKLGSTFRYIKTVTVGYLQW